MDRIRAAFLGVGRFVLGLVAVGLALFYGPGACIEFGSAKPNANAVAACEALIRAGTAPDMATTTDEMGNALVAARTAANQDDRYEPLATGIQTMHDPDVARDFAVFSVIYDGVVQECENL
jgi:hypothetical protein